MKKNTLLTVIAIIAGVVAVLAAVATVLYVLDKKGICKLKKTNFSYSEEFPDEEVTEELPA